MSFSAALGPAHDIELPGGTPSGTTPSGTTPPGTTLRYHDRGDGPPVVFVHGLLVNSGLWRHVVPGLVDAGLRCLTPDWPLGSHSLPMPNADLTPPGVADLVASFLDRLDLHDVTLVGNDTGGAITQLVMTRHPERIGRVVLTPSDCYENFLPPLFRPLSVVAKVPGSMRPITAALRVRALHRLPFTFGWVSKRPVPADVVDSYLLPSRRSGAIRADLRRFLAGIHRRYTLEAAEKFGEFDKPVLLAWADEDRVFPLRYAERLARDLPHATIRTISDSYVFVPEDQPELLTEMIVAFTRRHAAP
ncbi:MAG TPA: alpha/beta hydrolase [Aldersonia sp.]